MKRNVLSLALLAIVLSVCFPAFAQPETVIVIRHAERGTEPAADPALSPAGRRRAALLPEILAHAKVTGIITTNFRRTRETAEAVAHALGIEPVVVAVRKEEMAAHVPEVVAAIQRLSGTVLVVGHSDTVPGIVAELTGVSLPKLCDTSYGQIFVVTPATKTFIRLRYGEPDPPAGEGCQ